MTRLINLIAVLLVMISGSTWGQRINPNKLSSCPKPNLQVYQPDRYAGWTNCWGKAEYVDSSGNGGDYVYTGEFLAGRFHGFGRIEYPKSEFIYEGAWKNGMRHGDGVLYKQGNIYQAGQFIENVFIEKKQPDRDKYSSVQQVNPNKLPPCPKPDYSKKTDTERFAKWTNCWGRYRAELTEGNKGDVLEGEWKNGYLNGQGTYTQADGDRYEGEFQNGLPNGQVTIYFLADNQFKGHRYQGEYKDGKRHGQGTFTYASGDRYQGEYKDGNRHGQGTLTFANGDRYQGEHKDDKYHGQGIYTKADGTRYEGIFENDDFIREAKVNLPNLNNNIAANTEIIEIDRERQQLAEERKRLEEDKRQREQQSRNQRLNLTVSNTQPANDGSFTINVQTNADTASLKINGNEEGGSQDGRYSIRLIARAGQPTTFNITATDVYGNTDTKTITVSRQVVESKAIYTALNPTKVKKQPERDAVAVVIGIADYRSLPKAEYANDDARAFYDYAIRALGVKPENIKLLVDGDAEEVEIIKAFKTWLPSKVKSTTDVYVYYSGHGLPTQDGQGLYLLPPRADRDFIARTSIQFQEVNSDIQATKPKSVTVFMDACYSGQARSGETLVASARPVVLKSDKKLFPDNFTVIAASQSDQISSSSPDLKHGIFSYYLMKGMEGEADANKDGRITLGEMQAYLVENVGRQAGMMSRKQEPQLIGDAGRVLVGR
jgi:hypothetical protein